MVCGFVLVLVLLLLLQLLLLLLLRCCVAVAEPSRVVATEMRMTMWLLRSIVLRLEVLTEPSETGLLGLQLGAWGLGTFGAGVAVVMVSLSRRCCRRRGRRRQPKSQSRERLALWRNCLSSTKVRPGPGCRCLLMLALVLVVLIRGPGPAWAGPRVSPDWKCNKTADATGICDDHRRVTSQKKKEEMRKRRDGMRSPAIGGWPTAKNLEGESKVEGEPKPTQGRDGSCGLFEVVVVAVGRIPVEVEVQDETGKGQVGGRKRGGERERCGCRCSLEKRAASSSECICRCFCYSCCCYLLLAAPACACVLAVPIRVISTATPCSHPPSRDATARQQGQGTSCGVQLQSMMERPPCHCYGYLLPAGAAAAAACRELENVGGQGYPSVGLASWRYLLWYSAFSGFSRPHFTLPQ